MRPHLVKMLAAVTFVFLGSAVAQTTYLERQISATWDVGAQDVVALSSRSPVAAAQHANPGPDGTYEIDLMVVFTPRYAKRYGGLSGARAEVTRLVGLANGYFSNTSLPIHYRLVASEEYSGISETVAFKQTLSLLRKDPAIIEYRNGVGADLVALLRTNDFNADLCGFSTGFNGMVNSNSADHVDPEADAFMVAGVGPDEGGTRCADFVFGHELGHTLAGGHDYLSTGSDKAYWKAYSHGWQCGVTPNGGQFASIMSYGTTGKESRGEFFSSPTVTMNGQPCGSDGDPSVEASQANNARAILEAAPYVAAYREPAQK